MPTARITESEAAIAERIARQAHVADTKKLRHVERVVALVAAARHEPVTAVAWLHDVIEDSDLTAEDLLERGVSAAVVDAVCVLTRDDREAYTDYVERVRGSRNALAIAVKVADLRDHLRPSSPPEKRGRYERALARLGEVPDR
jgi:(p)ppGpp synthase/HD superfamily hydrolase